MGRIMVDETLKIQGLVFIGPVELRGHSVTFSGNEVFGSLEVDTTSFDNNEIENNVFHSLVDISIWKRIVLCFKAAVLVWKMSSTRSNRDN